MLFRRCVKILKNGLEPWHHASTVTRIDRLLAAHAPSIAAAAVTNNKDGFADVPGLWVENRTA